MTTERRYATHGREGIIFPSPVIAEPQGRMYRHTTPYGDLTLEISDYAGTAHSPRRGDISLTLLQAKYLEALMRDPLAVLSPTALHAAVYPGEDSPNDDALHAVRAFVSRFHHKLTDDVKASPLIYSIANKDFSLTSNAQAAATFLATDAPVLREAQELPPHVFRHHTLDGTIWFLSGRNVVIFPNGTIAELTPAETHYFTKMLAAPTKIFSTEMLDLGAPAYNSRLSDDHTGRAKEIAWRLTHKLDEHMPAPVIYHHPLTGGYSLTPTR